ncbi:hypothetical protein ABT354_23240 [Streptomyces sp. NPDC000594]|uniref:hypothetical protein n=1 Tax=Streptomyces sp. NPDC000594 TaxID=3154261 RepID=UPI003330A93A
MTPHPRIVVEPPDARGLRQVTVDGEPAGGAWSERDLRRVLRHAGVPDDVDLADRATVYWHNADSSVWEQRPWHRRATITVMAAGLFGSMALLVDVGSVDAVNALTFAGRLTGLLFVLFGALAGVAAVASFDYWGKRTLRSSGALVLAGTLITLVSTGLLCFLWLQGLEYTPHLFAFVPLWLWSLWSVWMLCRSRAWESVPHPRRFTAGLTTTALLTTINVTYSSVYQPYATQPVALVEAKFGTPRPDPKLAAIHLPLTIRIENTGMIPLYAIASQYQVEGRRSAFEQRGRNDTRGEWQKDRKESKDSEFYAGSATFQRVGSGSIISNGYWFETKERFTQEIVIQVPRDADFNAVTAQAWVTFLRKDRVRIADEFKLPSYSWEKGAKKISLPKDDPGRKRVSYVAYQGEISHGNNFINVTRRVRYLTSWREIDKKGEEKYVSTISPAGSPDELAGELERRERYGMITGTSRRSAISFAALMNP